MFVVPKRFIQEEKSILKARLFSSKKLQSGKREETNTKRFHGYKINFLFQRNADNIRKSNRAATMVVLT
jgi:hypothetical protein